MVSKLHLINAMKTTYIVDQITPTFYVLTTLLMTVILMYFGSILLMAPGIVFSEEVYVTRLAEIFYIKNIAIVLLIGITWGHYPCRMQDRYVKKEMMSFWIFAVPGVYAGLFVENYNAEWVLKSGGGLIDFYPMSAVQFWVPIAIFFLIFPLLACQCTWMYVKGTIGRFFCSSFLFLSWLWVCNPETSSSPDYIGITMYWMLLCLFSAPGQFLAGLQGFIYGIAISRFLCVSPLALFPGRDVEDIFQQIPGVIGRSGKKFFEVY